MKRSLCLILGDQLNLTMSSLLGFDPQKDLIVMSEVREDVTYVKYHKKKIVFIFSAMRHFAEDLKQRGYPVKYTKLNDRNNTGSIFEEVERIRKIYEFDKFIMATKSTESESDFILIPIIELADQLINDLHYTPAPIGSIANIILNNLAYASDQNKLDTLLLLVIILFQCMIMKLIYLMTH